MYQHPGVYIEHVPSGLLAIEAASTSVAVFIGPTRRGPRGEPVFISSAGQYEDWFGELGGGKGGIRNLGQVADRMGFAVNASFTNGGSKAYVLRVAEAGAAPLTLARASVAIPNPADSGQGFTVTAADAGSWGNALIVHLRATDEATEPDLELGYTLEVCIELDGAFTVLESFSGLDMEADAARSIERVIAEQSRLIDIEGGAVPGDIAAVTANALQGTDLFAQLASGQLPLADTSIEITAGTTTVKVAFDANSADFAAVARSIQAQVRAGSGGNLPDFTARIMQSGGNPVLRIASNIVGTAGDVSVEAGDSAAAPLGLGGGGTTQAVPPTSLDAGELIEGYLTGGTNGVDAPASSEYDEAYRTLRDYRDVSIILLPALNWERGGDNSIIQAAITHCEFMKNCMVVVDPPDSSVTANQLTSPKSVKDLGAPTSPYTALYYPWLKVANPHYNEDTAANLPKTFDMPPSAFAAGVWSRTDSARGVWKAPAGLAATVRGTNGPNVLIGNDLQDNLNEWGVNCIRSIIGPNVIWGGRTLATKAKPEFRYVPVRRTQNMIGESLYRALQTVVFEPNDHKLWGTLRASVGDFMSGLYRAGAFQGEKASDAYYVLCGLGSTMTQGDIDAGIVRCVVGFAPLKPAEFVVVQIKQIVGQAA